MTTPIQKLPIDLQSFEIIREEGFLYVDKTRYIHEMLEGGRYYFMARPRRFGKTLMVSALKCFFTGRRELFDGLWIAEHGRWDWKPHPVISFDFNTIPHDTPDNFSLGIERSLNKTSVQHAISLEEPLLGQRFEELILLLKEKTGLPVVILIDEYDKPIIDHLGKGQAAMEIARANRDILKSFLGTLKGGEVSAHIRFVFITGVSKFSRVSIFSDLNNLIDISLNPKFAAMMGYTRDELTDCFPEHIRSLAGESGLDEAGALNRLTGHYDGYRFTRKPVQVCNPFSILRALTDLDFANYWFETGTPTFLINLLREKNYPLPAFEDLAVTEAIFSVYDLDHLGVEALLFQTGYLTIKQAGDTLWHLGYPNLEVKCAFLKHLFYSFTHELDGGERSRFMLLARYLERADLDAFFETVNAIFAAIPYTIKCQPNEAWFHTLFYLMVSASGAHVQSEVLTSRGRIDLVVSFADAIWIMEFKCGQSAEAALKQIREKGYADRYRSQGKALRLLGIHFDAETRSVTQWLMNGSENPCP